MSAYTGGSVLNTYENGRLVSEEYVSFAEYLVTYSFTYEYDTEGKLVKVTVTGEMKSGTASVETGEIVFTVNDAGAFVTTDDDNTLAVTFYDNGTLRSRAFASDANFTWTTEYDESGRLVKETSSQNVAGVAMVSVMTYAYADGDDTVANAMTYVSCEDTITVTPTFAENGLTKVVLSNGTTSAEYEFTFDADGKITGIAADVGVVKYSAVLAYVNSEVVIKSVDYAEYDGEQVEETRKIEYTYEDADTLLETSVTTYYAEGVAKQYKYACKTYALVEGEWTDATPESEEIEIELSAGKTAVCTFEDGVLAELYVINVIESNDAGLATKYTQTTYGFDDDKVDVTDYETETYTVTYNDNGSVAKVECVVGDNKYVITPEYDTEGNVIRETQESYENGVITSKVVYEYEGTKTTKVTTSMYVAGELEYVVVTEFDAEGNQIVKPDFPFVDIENGELKVPPVIVIPQ